MSENRIQAWHFLPADGRLKSGRKLPVRAGVTYVHKGPITTGVHITGLQASVRALNALDYAPGPIVCRVECWDRVKNKDDKLVCGRRRVLWLADATKALRLFACWCAEQALALITPAKVDPRSTAAIEVARQYAAEGASNYKDRTAVWDAEWAARLARVAVMSDADKDADKAAAWAAKAAAVAAGEGAKRAAWAAWDVVSEILPATEIGVVGDRVMRDAQNTKLTELLVALSTDRP